MSLCGRCPGTKAANRLRGSRNPGAINRSDTPRCCVLRRLRRRLTVAQLRQQLLALSGSSVLTVQFFKLLFDPVTLKRRQVIDEQLAVEVVAFVLNAHGQQAFGDHFEGLAITV